MITVVFFQEDKLTFQMYVYTQFNPRKHELFLQLYRMKWVPGDPKKENLN